MEPEDKGRRERALFALEQARNEYRNPPRADRPMPHLSAGRHYIPQRYVIGWPDGVVKIGETWNGRRRWGRFLASGGAMLDLAYYEDLGDALNGELWLERQVRSEYSRAFRSKADARAHLGSAGAGYTECYAIPVDDWPRLIELARS